MVRKKLPPPETKTEDEQRAFNICLLEPIGTTVYEVSQQATNLMVLLQKTKNKVEFQKTIEIYYTICVTLLNLVTSMNEIVKTMKDSQEISVEVPKIH